jgi:hypothetical protein
VYGWVYVEPELLEREGRGGVESVLELGQQCLVVLSDSDEGGCESKFGGVRTLSMSRIAAHRA